MKILFNATVHSLDPLCPQASVVVIDHDRVTAVGGPELLEAFSACLNRQDMGGETLLPGLTDAHIHLMNYAFSLQKVDVETATKAECLRRVAERAQKTAPASWLLGHGWQQNNWAGEFGSARELDEAAPRNPVYLTAKSLHASWANSAALQLAGITPNTPNPENGKIVRDESGNPTGILLESAMALIEAFIPQPTVREAAEAIRDAVPRLHRMGLTGAHDFDYRTAFMALQDLHAGAELKLRVLKSVPPDLLAHAHALGLRSGFGDDMLRIGSYKNFMDGALGPRTAAMFQPYLNEPENRGILNYDAEQLFEMARTAVESGLSVAVHAIGDRAVHEVLNAYEQLRGYERERGLPRLRHRIEHVQVIHPSDARRLAELDIIASMQPVHAISDMLAADHWWGERTQLAYAPRTQLEAGATLAFGSDAPVESPNPFLGLHAAVTRRRADGIPGPEGWHPEERLSISQALAGFTSGAAYAAGLEDRLGRLSPGYYADLIALEEDPFTCDPDALLSMQPSATMLAGEWVWQS
ncbi:MAG: amidohydrolase [Anaerolineales bacterium]|jgi:predicted amidohydrolase YtcJ|nr:amidohydrolase [Anaerolineales bacterium]